VDVPNRLIIVPYLLHYRHLPNEVQNIQSGKMLTLVFNLEASNVLQIPIFLFGFPVVVSFRMIHSWIGKRNIYWHDVIPFLILYFSDSTTLICYHREHVKYTTIGIGNNNLISRSLSWDGNLIFSSEWGRQWKRKRKYGFSLVLLLLNNINRLCNKKQESERS